MLCNLCHKEIIDTNYIKQGKKRYHKNCFEQLQNEAENKDQNTISNLKSDERQSLSQYIMKLYHIDKIPFLIEKQVQEYVEKYNYTYSGIQKSLYYFYEIQKNNFDESKQTIGIVPYVYDETKKYYLDIYQANITNKDKDIKDDVKTIKISPPNKNLKCTINIQDL